MPFRLKPAATRISDSPKDGGELYGSYEQAHKKEMDDLGFSGHYTGSDCLSCRFYAKRNWSFLIRGGKTQDITGCIGVAVGILSAFAICWLMNTCLLLSPLTVFLALGFSMSIGIVFGYAPARKASKLSPIDALRCV